jgi:hypothetical protein
MKSVPCTRCHGRLLRDDIYPGIWWWKCWTCGERVDRVILRHRAEQAYEAELQRSMAIWGSVSSS